MKTLQKKIFVLLLFITCLLSACGGTGGKPEATMKERLSGPPSAAPTQSLAVVAGTRNSYFIKRTSTTFTLTDRGIVGGVTTLNANQTSVKFTDFTVNLLIGDKSKTIPAGSLQNLVELYIAFFNRVPDADGMNYWIEQLYAGMTFDQLADHFYNAAIVYSDQTGYSDNLSNADFVRIIYKNVLRRFDSTAPTDEEVNYWANALNSGAWTKGKLVLGMLNSAHTFENDATWGWVPKLLDNKRSVGIYFAITQGLSYNTNEASIAQGMAIAKEVTSTDTKTAIDLIGVTDSAFDLRITAPLPQVTMSTSFGDIIIELNSDKAPITVTNFLKYTDSGFYSNKIFHRVISNFMIQGGGFDANMVQAQTYSPIKLEANNGLSNLRGSIAMARTSLLDSATSQFFINVVDNTFLDTSGGGYAVFGKVISGMDIVDKIKDVPTSTRGQFGDVPIKAVTIISVTRSN